jgi:hypothetical protein
MRSLEVLLASTVLLSLAVTGCSFDPHLDTTGDKGNLQFRYSSCLLGCALDKNALQGSRISLSVSGGDPNTSLSARLAADAQIGTIAYQSQSCSCESSSNGSTDSRTVTATDKCTAAETKKCFVSVDIETTRVGDAKLEVIDASGKLVDSATLHIRPAARIDVTVQDRTPGAGGVYEVPQGAKLKVASRVLDADDNEMVFAQHGVSQVYADASIVGPDHSIILGSSDVEDAIAKAPGETSLALRAAGAESIVRFRVR